MKKTASAIARRSLPALLRIGTAGILDGRELAEELGTVLQDVAEDRIEAYEEGKSEIRKFRDSLSELATKVTRLDGDVSGKVIVLVDELDRCRPLYAVELLERVKHLFSIEDIVFVLGVDRQQLSHSVRALYGADLMLPATFAALSMSTTGCLSRRVDATADVCSRCTE